MPVAVDARHVRIGHPLDVDRVGVTAQHQAGPCAGAGQLADDIASMVTWWQGQDPTRVPRWDQAAFGAASCLDVSFVRLSGSAASYAGNGASSAFARVSAEIANAGEGNRYKKYLVYFDGPSVQEDVCGTGAGDFAAGAAYAVVWLGGAAARPGGRSRGCGCA